MKDTVLKVRDLSKRYTIGRARGKPQTIQESLLGWLRRGFGRSAERPEGSTKENTREIWALKDVSFDIERGEIVGVIGRNGAGKSTLLKILSGIVEPTAGRAELRGRVGSLLELGVGFHGELSGRENVFLNGAIHGFSRSGMRSKFDEIVEFAGIERFIDTPVKRYSSGMYVRLAFSVAAHMDPEILIVDEVLAAGDVSFQQKCLAKMDELTGQGRTVLYVSHNMGSVRSLCHRAMLLESGQIASEGDTGDVIMDYLQRLSITSDVGIEYDGTVGDHAAKVRLLDVKGKSEGREEGLVYLWKQPIRLSLEFEVLEPIEDAVFGVGVLTRDHEPILYVHHSDQTNRAAQLEPGRYRVDVDLHNVLRAGQYWIHAVVRDGSTGNPIFSAPQAARFDVLEFSRGGEPYISYNAGMVNGQAEWKITGQDSDQVTNGPDR